MHELGVVFHVMDDVRKVCEENEITDLQSITLQLGTVSGVIPSYLTDCFMWAREKEELFKKCELIVEPIEAVTYCEDCKEMYDTVKHGKTCPKCGSNNTYLYTGNEFMIKEIAGC